MYMATVELSDVLLCVSSSHMILAWIEAVFKITPSTFKSLRQDNMNQTYFNTDVGKGGHFKIFRYANTIVFILKL